MNYYVYRLTDPRNGQTFYVGKGTGDSVLLKRIREIKNDGFEVTHIIHRHDLDEKTALEVEAALIDAYPEALNKVAGHDSDERGIMHARKKKELAMIPNHEKEIYFQHKVLAININISATEAHSIYEVYEAVRCAWRLDVKRAQEAEFVLAEQQGRVIGVFVAKKWFDATKHDFPRKEDLARRHNLSGRWFFVGEEAPDEIKKLYLGSRLPAREQGAANPVRYFY